MFNVIAIWYLHIVEQDDEPFDIVQPAFFTRWIFKTSGEINLAWLVILSQFEIPYPNGAYTSYVPHFHQRCDTFVNHFVGVPDIGHHIHNEGGRDLRYFVNVAILAISVSGVV